MRASAVRSRVRSGASRNRKPDVVVLDETYRDKSRDLGVIGE